MTNVKEIYCTVSDYRKWKIFERNVVESHEFCQQIVHYSQNPKVSYNKLYKRFHDVSRDQGVPYLGGLARRYMSVQADLPVVKPFSEMPSPPRWIDQKNLFFVLFGTHASWQNAKSSLAKKQKKIEIEIENIRNIYHIFT